TDRLPSLEDMDPGECYLYWDFSLLTELSEQAIRGEFIFIEDDLEDLRIVPFALPGDEAGGCQDREDCVPKLGELLVQQGDLSAAERDRALSSLPRLGQVLVTSGAVAESKIRAALNQQKLLQSAVDKAPKEAAISSVRVASDKLDELVNQVGELVIAQARLRQIIDLRVDDQDLVGVAEEISRLTENLRDSTMGIRMLPIGTLFSRFNRLVRDLSRELSKDIELVTQGDETELDKTVIENLNDPLVHIIRNSIDHGIETPAERKRRGKSPKGRVNLSAIHSGANVLIRIQDDGQGLQRERILDKAVQKGLVEPGVQLDDSEVYALIFAPGFSTAETITNVSGRGVGMDVVRKAIDSLRGEIDVDSQPGQGTTLTIKLPLTLAIIDGFLVQSAGVQFVLPLSTVKECVKLTRQDVEGSHGRQIINIRNEIVPYVRLRDIFRLPGERLTREQVVITEVDRIRVGMVVDHVIGQNQVVIKSLGEVFQNVAEFSGATILGDGRVVPILDVARIIDRARTSMRLQ
ncbi:MAG: chemotaxis protein CheA, partial [Magnetococcus sp. WYHC-3]